MSVDRDLLSALVGLMNEDREAFIPARLSILVYLYFTHSAKFTNIQKKLNLTSGNLSSHIRKLEAIGLVSISKGFVDLRPTTVVFITDKGMGRVREQLFKMRELVSAVVEQEDVPTEAESAAELRGSD